MNKSNNRKPPTNTKSLVMDFSLSAIEFDSLTKTTIEALRFV